MDTLDLLILDDMQSYWHFSEFILEYFIIL